MADSGDGFVSRWSRRKRAQPDERPAEAEAPPPGPAPDVQATEAELVESLPDIDSLTEDSDFTVFLRDGVPEALRRRALRRLWRLNPVFANLDGLAEYDEDYTLATSALQGAVKTIYQVGKGMVSEEPEEATAAEPPEPGAEGAPEAPPSSGETAVHGADDDGPQDRAALESPAESSPLADPGRVAPDTPAETAAVPRNPVRGRARERRWGRFEG